MPETQRHLGRGLAHAFAWLLLSPALAACSDQDASLPDNSAELQLSGIWNADLEYARNGGSDVYRWAQNHRFDIRGKDWQCWANGVSAKTCEFSGQVSSFALEAVDQRSSESWVRTRTLTLGGIKKLSPNSFEASYHRVTHYDYVDGTLRPDIVDEGKATLHRVLPHDQVPTQGFRVLGEFGEFADRRGNAYHDENEGETGGKEQTEGVSTANVRVAGNHAFLAQFSAGLRVLDIQDPSAIVEVGHAPVENIGASYYNDVKLFETGGKQYAVVSDNRIGLVVYDVSDPTVPTPVSSFFPGLRDSEDSLNNHTVFMVGTTAYLGNYGGSVALDPEGGGAVGGLLIVDLSDPLAPKELGRWLASEAGGTFVHDLYIEDGIAYLSAWEAGLVVLDVADPKAPKILGQFGYNRMANHSVWVTEVGGRRIAVTGDEDFGAHIRLVDVTPDSSAFMTQISEFQLRPEVSVHNIVAHGSEVTAAWYQDGVRVLDISKPEEPKLVAWHNTWKGPLDASLGRSFFEGGIGVEVQGKRVYLADIQRGLIVLERE